MGDMTDWTIENGMQDDLEEDYDRDNLFPARNKDDSDFRVRATEFLSKVKKLEEEYNLTLFVDYCEMLSIQEGHGSFTRWVLGEHMKAFTSNERCYYHIK